MVVPDFNRVTDLKLGQVQNHLHSLWSIDSNVVYSVSIEIMRGITPSH